MSQVPLTAEQRRVVDCPHGPGTVTVQAVAGSGKTHVLIERARALGGRGVKPEQILFVTFTSAAKDTLRARLNKARLNRCRALTIHGLLSSVLPREHFAYDHDEVERLVLATYRAFPCGYRKFERFARALGTAWMHFQLTGPEMRVEHPVLGSALCRFGALREAFEDHFGRMLMGHDDLLIWGHRTLESGDTSIHDRLTSYQVMIADEYQDVSPLQSAIIETLAQGKHLMVVADPAQSIFGFQGSTGESFLRLARESPPLLLSDNFRCPGTHLLAASAQLQDTQRLVPAKGFCGDLQVEWSGTHEDLFARLAVRIAALSQAGEEITILVRLTEVEKEVVTFLRRRGYQVVNLKTPSEQLFKNPACRDILRPTLEVLKRRRAAEHPLKKTLNFLGHQLTADERRWLDGTWSSRRTPGEARPSTGALSPELELALRLWSDLYGFTGDSRALLSLLRPYLAPVDRGQWELLESLLDREMSLLDLETALQTAEQPSAQKIHVRTIHNAKGREFPCVVLFELPQEKKAQGAGGKSGRPDDLHDSEWGSATTDDSAVPEVTCTEEDRVCYVALTRSTRLLYAILPYTSNFTRALEPGQLNYVRHVQHLLAQPHHQWSQADVATWPRLIQDPALTGYLDRYWWEHTDPATLRRARQVLTDAALPVPASWTSEVTASSEPLKTTFKIRRIPFRIPKS